MTFKELNIGDEFFFTGAPGPFKAPTGEVHHRIKCGRSAYKKPLPYTAIFDRECLLDYPVCLVKQKFYLENGYDL